MRNWEGHVDSYIKECESRGLADTTLYTRTLELDRFGSWLRRRKPRPKLEQIDGPLIIRYVEARTIFKSKATVCTVLTELRGMGEYLVREGVWINNPLRWIRGPKLDSRMKIPRRINRQDLRDLWAQARKSHSQYRQHLAIALLSLLYGTGIRRGELERLDLSDWNREDGILQIDGRKTGQQRSVPVGPSVWKCIEAYLPHRRNHLEKTGRMDQVALFVNRHGARLSGQAIANRIRGLARRAGIPLITLHQFRHTCASDLLESGVPLPEVQGILGHAVIESTMRYTAVADPQRAEAMALHPINEFLANRRCE